MTLPRLTPVPPQSGSQKDPLPELAQIAGVATSALMLQSRIRLSVAQPSFSISVGPNTDFVVVVANLRGDTAANTVDVAWRMNGDTGNNYTWDQLFQANGATGASNSSVATSTPMIAQIPAANAFNTRFGWALMFFVDLQSLVSIHRGIGWSSYIAVINSVSAIVFRDGDWNQPVPTTSISLFPASGNFAAGSLFKVFAL